MIGNGQEGHQGIMVLTLQDLFKQQRRVSGPPNLKASPRCTARSSSPEIPQRQNTAILCSFIGVPQSPIPLLTRENKMSTMPHACVTMGRDGTIGERGAGQTLLCDRLFPRGKLRPFGWHRGVVFSNQQINTTAKRARQWVNVTLSGGDLWEGGYASSLEHNSDGSWWWCVHWVRERRRGTRQKESQRAKR